MGTRFSDFRRVLMSAALLHKRRLHLSLLTLQPWNQTASIKQQISHNNKMRH
jgi:hypothetical protein